MMGLMRNVLGHNHRLETGLLTIEPKLLNVPNLSSVQEELHHTEEVIIFKANFTLRAQNTGGD